MGWAPPALAQAKAHSTGTTSSLQSPSWEPWEEVGRQISPVSFPLKHKFVRHFLVFSTHISIIQATSSSSRSSITQLF